MTAVNRLLTLIAATAIACTGALVRAQEQPFITNTPRPTATVTPAPTMPTGTIFVTVPMTDAQRADGSGIEIVDMTLERSLNTLEAVTLTLENTTDAPLDGVSWYVLAPSYVIEEPWRQAAYIAPIELVSGLAPGEVRAVRLPPPADASLIGEYTISGWVHLAEADGTTRHSDGLGFERPIVVGPPLFLTIDTIDLVPVSTGASGEHTVYVTMTLRNYSPQFAEIAYSYALAAPDAERPWEDGIFALPYQSFIMLPGSQITLTSRDRVILPDGQTFAATGYLQQNLDGEYEFRSSYRFHQAIRAES
jgi:hypothetical protein